MFQNKLHKIELTSSSNKTMFNSSSVFDKKTKKTNDKKEEKITAKKEDYFQSQGTAQLEQMKSMYKLGITYFPFLLVAGMAVVIGGKQAYKKLTTKTSTSHGSARFATRREIKHLLRPMDEPIKEGELRVGKYIETWRPKHKYVSLPRNIVNRHVLIVGPSGAGKSRALFLPNCYYNKGTSFLATDPKSELWEQTSGLQECPIRFAPMEPDKSIGFNPIPACRDIDIAERLAIAIVYARGEEGDPFYYLTQQQLLKALIAHVAHSSVPTLTHVYELISLGGFAVIPILQESPNESARRMSTSFVGLNEKLLTGAVQALTGKLSWLENPKLRQFTSSVDYTFDFAELRRRPIQMYWCLNEDDVTKIMELTAAFFNMAMVALKRAEDKKVSVNFYFDEFGNIGRLTNFENDITLIRSRDLAVIGCLQNIAQLEKIYGRVNAQIIWANFNTKFVLNGLENATAEMISKTLGDYTYLEEKLSTSRAGMFAKGTTESESAHARKLLTPDELRTYSKKKMILISTELPAITLDRLWYEDRPNNIAKLDSCPEEIKVPSYEAVKAEMKAQQSRQKRR
jgi:type IV secretion system protein VirD4